MAEREGARAAAAEAAAEAKKEGDRETVSSDRLREGGVATTVEVKRTTAKERKRAEAEAAVDVEEAVDERDGSIEERVRKAGGSTTVVGKKPSVARRIAGGAKKKAGKAGGWLASELNSDWNRTALGFGERVRKVANVVGNVVFNPLMRIGAAIENWGAGYPPFSWFKKKADTSKEQEDMFEDYGKGEGKEKK